MKLLQLLRHTLHLDDGQDSDMTPPIPEFDDTRERDLKRRVDALEELANVLRKNPNDPG